MSIHVRSCALFPWICLDPPPWRVERAPWGGAGGAARGLQRRSEESARTSAGLCFCQHLLPKERYGYRCPFLVATAGFALMSFSERTREKRYRYLLSLPRGQRRDQAPHRADKGRPRGPPCIRHQPRGDPARPGQAYDGHGQAPAPRGALLRRGPAAAPGEVRLRCTAADSFFYMPHKGGRLTGLAIVNFASPLDVCTLHAALASGLQQDACGRPPANQPAVSYARFQGHEELVRHFRVSAVLQEPDPEKRPIFRPEVLVNEVAVARRRSRRLCASLARLGQQTAPNS
ncbi:unnamed protein product [Prorocentrum cordatum]|uniref:Uncharacterized protein n=1 Tax=Prorocentrum cordatum TaxID=2364126 RepID=A0ABN9PS36_9DINO|nr:unnamed protein product [Polarella glacialis]